MYGYRPAEWGVVLGAGERPDLSFRVRKFRKEFYQESERKSVRVSLGCHVEGASLPVPDFDHAPSILAGCTKRVAAEMPAIQPHVLRRFRRFCKRFVRKRLSCLKFDATTTFDFDEWVDMAPYPDYRKDELRRVHAENCVINYQSLHYRQFKSLVKSFVKDENYPEPKHFRGIYSRDDAYKVRVGPFFKKFGDRLFHTPWFIKLIPVPDRPQALFDKLDKYDKIFCTDFSQFESTFVVQLMNIELDVYRWTLEGHPFQKELCDLFSHMANQNTIQFKTFTCSLAAKRMSGEMNTSCGNGLMNLLMTSYVLERAGNDLDKVDYFFEGDDGIIGCTNIPTPQLYTEIGAKIKIELPTSISEASFCGNVFDPNHMHNVANPSEALVSFGWTKARNYRYASDPVLRQLLRAKSLSYLYQYPGCPILRSLALYGLRMTEGVKITDAFFLQQSDSAWHYEMLKAAQDVHTNKSVFAIVVQPGTRLLVERLYGISVSSQLFIEKYLDNLTRIQPLDLVPVLNVPLCWRQNDIRYTTHVDRHSTRDPSFVMKGFTTLAYSSPQVLMAYHH